ncbi:MarR family transcriptional regulator, partial [Acetobacter orientalis]
LPTNYSDSTMATTIKKLRRQGHSVEDIELARQIQDGARQQGAPVRSLYEILNGLPARARPSAPPEDLTVRQLRKRGVYGQAAILVDQAALTEKNTAKAQKARDASTALKELAEREQLEFDLFRGNVMTADEYHDAIRARLMASRATPARRAIALATLQEIKRWLGWQSFTCTKTAADLCDLLGFDKVTMSDTLALLEEIGAITRVKRGRIKDITVTPEGAFRGDLMKHADQVRRYKSEVVDLASRR